MARLGLDYEAVRAINPRIIYCAITGYGQEGPKAQRAGHDLNYIAETGLLALSTGPREAPPLPPVLIADLMGGTYPAVMAVAMALFRRERTAEGGFSRHLHDAERVPADVLGVGARLFMPAIGHARADICSPGPRRVIGSTRPPTAGWLPSGR